MIDECHRGSAADDSAWREILEYFSSATQIGLTATPKETKYVSNIVYFGEPTYSCSLKQGIRDGFLAPYKVVKLHIDHNVEGYRPEGGQLDREGEEVEDRIHNVKDFDRTLVIDGRTKVVARKVGADEVKARGYNLDIRNPYTAEENYCDPESVLAELTAAEAHCTMEPLRRCKNSFILYSTTCRRAASVPCLVS